ncbi:hypothetical protein CLV24_11737 [Pontibacter ummariensis]|uniref:GIY-YIG domain-containing protein n=1 Tax=Pontibacter ummariensis TaxID=1610492 RepID=A0A239IGJ9_9BACT|nr:hypothetical protein CLV24_11737 [Pontibacter ummariensis]SNS92552.1 hypothetical protein SAMN06296052_11737 [Pontibacter ummariensis]
MATQTFRTENQGYWRDRNKNGFPNHSRVYFVYEASYNANSNTVPLSHLIYIGEAGDVGGRTASHEKCTDWLKYVQKDNELCFSTACVQSQDRIRVEAAYIYKHKSPVNTEYKYVFPFDQTTVISTG